MILGVHVDQHDPIGEAKARGAQAVQIMLGNPQSFKDVDLRHPGGAEELRQEAREANVDIYVHSHYVINVASTNNRVRIPSRKLLQRIIDGSAEIGAKGVVVHGGHVAADDELETGFDNWRKCIDGLDLAVPVLIENTAGGKFAMARGLERLEKLWNALRAADGYESVGFCLDTCHAFAGGEELTGLADRVRTITGRIDLVHANDSQGDFNSGVDRHANLGDGQIPPEDLATVIREAAAPIILETPGGVEGHLADLAWLRERL